MRKDLLDFLAALNRAEDPGATLISYFSALGARTVHVWFGYTPRDQPASTYPAWWSPWCFREVYPHHYVYQQAPHRLDPILWGLDRDLGAPGRTASDLKIAQAGYEGFGLRSAFVVPIRTINDVRGGISFGMGQARDEADALLAAHAPAICAAAYSAHAVIGASRVSSAHGANRLIRLTPRERDTLSAFASGLDTAGVADRLRIAEVTVRLHLHNARRKLGARTRSQAIAEAVRQQLIPM